MIPTHYLLILSDRNFNIKAIINLCNAYFSGYVMYNHRSQDFRNPKVNALRKYIHQEACFIYNAPPFNAFAWRMNENSETVELPLTDSICPPDLLSSDRGSGQGCGTGRDTGPRYGTNIWANDADTGVIQSSGTRAWTTLISTGMGYGNGQRKRATSTGKSS